MRRAVTRGARTLREIGIPIKPPGTLGKIRRGVPLPRLPRITMIEGRLRSPFSVGTHIPDGRPCYARSAVRTLSSDETRPELDRPRPERKALRYCGFPFQPLDHIPCCHFKPPSPNARRWDYPYSLQTRLPSNTPGRFYARSKGSTKDEAKAARPWNH